MTDDALARNLGRGNTGHVPVTLKKFRWRARSKIIPATLIFRWRQVPARDLYT